MMAHLNHIQSHEIDILIASCHTLRPKRILYEFNNEKEVSQLHDADEKP